MMPGPPLSLRARIARLFAPAAVLLMAAAGLPHGAAAQTEIIKGPYIVADVESGTVLEHHQAMRPWYPASTTKMMTAYVTFRAIEAGEITLQSPVVMSEKAAAQPPSKMDFKPGAVLTIDNALKIVMVKSANDVAVALGEAVGGSEEAFAERMNAEARRLGMTRSHFVNPHGLPDERQVTTARDMALLARALLTEFSHYRSYYNIPAIQYGNEIMPNFNGLVSRYPGTTGLKTGYICSSGFNLVASARRGEHELVAVVFGTYSGQDRAERAAALLDAGFRSEGLFGRARTTLDNVTSGIGFREPLDMRPEICTDRRREVLEEIAGEPEFKTLPGGVVVRMRGPPRRDTPLGPPRDMGPPVRVALGGAVADTPVAAGPLPATRPEPSTPAEPSAGTAAAYAASRAPPAAAVTGTAVRGDGVPMPRPRPTSER